MSDITIVCCYNNQGVYNNLVNSLKTQTCNYELIGIDNTGNKKFSSCAGAYNSVLNEIRTKYVIFSHQDILLNEPDSLAKFLEYLDKIAPHDILGVAGVKFNNNWLFSDIKHYDKFTCDFVNVGNYAVSDNFMSCDTVDECFFGGYSEHFKANPFDEKICDNWHLYAVDSCLHTKSKCAGNIWICGVNIIHISPGNTNYKFFCGFYRLCKKYSQDFPIIRTTCAFARTDKFSHFMIDITKLIFHKKCVSIVRTLQKAGIYDALKKILFYDTLKKFVLHFFSKNK